MTMLERLAEGEGHAHFAYGPLLVHVWWSKMTDDSVRTAARLGREMAQRHPDGIGSMTIATDGLPIPSREAQRVGSEAMVESQAWLQCNAVVLLGSGFWASAARGCYTAMQFVVRHRSPQKVFATADDAVSWCVQHLPALVGHERRIVERLAADCPAISP